MRTVFLTLALATFVVTDSRAALFTSTATPAMQGGGPLNFSTSLLRVDNNNELAFLPTGVIANAGATSVTITTDTVADTARYDSMSLIAPSVAMQTKTSHTALVSYGKIVTPANFPDPPVIETVTGSYFSRVIYTSLTTSGSPMLLTSTMSPLIFENNVFRTVANVTLAPHSLTLNGAYEAHGPTTTVMQPFSIVYNMSPGFKQAHSTIPGGAGFGDGFPFTTESMVVFYTPTPASLIVFNQVVDNVRFRAIVQPFAINYFEAIAIPEPSAAALTAFCLLIAWRRDSQLRPRPA